MRENAFYEPSQKGWCCLCACGCVGARRGCVKAVRACGLWRWIGGFGGWCCLCACGCVGTRRGCVKGGCGRVVCGGG
ncbi:hypothetical protein MNL11_07130 [Bartonella krasnovii]|uniref:hypothetical protein n=1 Tax=Bartonella krasnovii TaxID=2267275 RepID=UPI001F4CC2BA|nr:hypothetical protein [Bartonella krasnovii]UNF36843.1 hypothetical protein MNL11_07130 [Bartonella krasnovii]